MYYVTNHNSPDAANVRTGNWSPDVLHAGMERAQHASGALGVLAADGQLATLPEESALADSTNGGWRALAKCKGVDPDSFFPDYGAANPVAQAICSRCVVKSECLEYAFSHDIRDGIWGGMSGQERGSIRRRAGKR